MSNLEANISNNIEVQKLILEQHRLAQEKELKLKELETQRQREAGIRWMVPIFTALIVGTLGVVGNFVNNKANLELEERRKQGSLIVEAIKTDSKRAAANLIFLAETGLINLDENQLTTLKKEAGSDSSPSLPSPQISVMLSQAQKYERDGFNAILSGDLANARNSFALAYGAYPTFHNVDEIYHRVLTQDLIEKYTNSSAEEKEQILLEIMTEIVAEYNWHMPEDLLREMNSRVSSAEQ